MNMNGQLHCRSCGYDATGVRGAHCPECGQMLDVFTLRAREVIQLANRTAVEMITGTYAYRRQWRWWHMFFPAALAIQPVHILLGIATGPNGVGRAILASQVPELEVFVRVVAERAQRGVHAYVHPGARLGLDPNSKRVAETAKAGAHRLGHSWIGTEHLLLALATSGGSLVKSILGKHGITAAGIEAAIVENVASLEAITEA